MVYHIVRSDDWLEHHGIKGQKWGVENGPPYPLDYEDHNAVEKKENAKGSLDNYENHNEKDSHSDNNSKVENKTTKNDSHSSSDSKLKDETKEKKSLHDRRVDKLMAKGLTKEEAENQIKFENRAIAIAAVTAAALGGTVAYGLITKGNIEKDFVLPAGKEMFRVASSDDTDVRDMIYATTNKLDAKKYAGMYANQKIRQAKAAGLPTDIYQKILASKSDIKIAGATTGKQVFEELYKTDPEFKKATFGLSYDAFNKHTIMSEKNTGAVKKFFDALQEKGYGGVIDINDAKYSGYAATKPVILFNQQKNINTNSVRKLANEEINKNNLIGSLASLGQTFLGDTTNTSLQITKLGILGLAATGVKYTESLGVETSEDQPSSKKK